MPELTQQQILESLTVALTDSRDRTEKQFGTLEQKLDQLGRDLSALEARIRLDLQTQFVTKAEFEPRYRMHDLKLDEFDRHVVVSAQEAKELAVAQVEIKQVREDLEALEGRVRGAWQRATPWIALLLSALSVLSGVLQHIQIK